MKNFLPRLFQKPKVKTIYLYPFGEFYNLKEILLSLNKEYFDDKLELKITWFGKGRITKTRLLFGSYDSKLKLIKVNRILDEKNIPEYVVKFIIYHEMLHHIFPIKIKNRRRSIHHREFKEKEKKFPEYLEATKFLKQLATDLFKNSQRG